MKDRVRRVLAVVAVCAVVAGASSCTATKRMVGLGPKYYDLEIRARSDLRDKLQSLYVIVTESYVVKQKEGGALLDGELRSQYLTYVQYAPTEGPAWKKVSEGTPHHLVEVETSDMVINLRINDDLVESTPYTVVVLASYGGKGFKDVKVPEANLENTLDQMLDVGADSLLLTTAE